VEQHCRECPKENSSLRRRESCQEFHIGRMLRTGEEARVADDLAFDGGREIEFWVKDACLD
jgi:plasmid stability protein